MTKLRATAAVWAMATVALLAGTAGAGVKYVAVVETEVDAQSGAAGLMGRAEAHEITAELRREAVRNLPQDRYNIMTSETVQSMGGAVLEECAEENCVITLGSKIGADYIVRGVIRKIQTRLSLAVEIYETENGTLVALSEAVRSENFGELLDKAAGVCGEMYRKFARVGGGGGGMQTAAVAQSAGGYTANARDGRSYLRDQYEDFTAEERWGTWALNVPGGLGSFIIMKDNVGGCILAGTTAIIIASAVIGTSNVSNQRKYGGYYNDDDYDENRYLQARFVGKVTMIAGYVALVSGQTFNIVRSATYRKPSPKSAAGFKHYDGLKFSILPTESGDCKVFARYDYSF